MDSYLLEVLNLLGRWLHLIVGIAWIGASFYFVWLDDHLQPAKDPEDTARGVGGEVWSVHGGGFYHAQKYAGVPGQLPDALHWFKWEAYATWLSGVFLLVLIYWYGAEIYTIDPGVADISKTTAIAVGAATLIFGWLIYDFICKTSIANNARNLGLVILVFVSVVAIILCQVFSGRAAYIHFAAMLGTIMSANVFFVIIPGQKALVDSAQRNTDLDPSYALRARQRSVHNTYFTLPVLFVMISNHYAMTFGHAYNWLILIGISVAGALIRVYFVARHKNNASVFSLLIAGGILLAVFFIMAPSTSKPGDFAKVDFSDVRKIMTNRCVSCHSHSPTQAGFSSAPAGVMFDSDAEIVSKAAQIQLQVVVSKVMPVGNLTGMTEQERETIDIWVKTGASMQ